MVRHQSFHFPFASNLGPHGHTFYFTFPYIAALFCLFLPSRRSTRPHYGALRPGCPHSLFAQFCPVSVPCHVGLLMGSPLVPSGPSLFVCRPCSAFATDGWAVFSENATPTRTKLTDPRSLQSTREKDWNPWCLGQLVSLEKHKQTQLKLGTACRDE